MEFQKYILYLRKYLSPQAGRALTMALMICVSSGLALASPQVIRFFIDSAQSGGEQRLLLAAAGMFLAFAFFQQAATLLSKYLSNLVGLTATNRLSADLTLHCLRLDMTFHKQHTPGEMIERVTGDVSVLGSFFSQFAVKSLGNLLLIAGILTLLFWENLWVGAGMVVYTLLSFLVLAAIQHLGEKRWESERQSSAEQFGYIEERISGAEELRAAGAEAYALRRLYILMRDLLKKRRAAYVAASLTENLTNLVYVLGYSTGLALGVLLYTRGEASLGTAYLILNYVGMLAVPLETLRAQASDLQQAAASLRRIDALFTQQPLASASANRSDLLAGRALSVSFREVSFHYEKDEVVLHRVSFQIQPGRVLGILGRTGSGKSTLSRLLFRLYDPTGGKIAVNGVDLRQLSQSELRQRVGMVTQDVQLFQATLRENLCLFDPAVPTHRIEQVIRELGLWEWVQSLPGGLDYPLQSGGQGISAGEAQLLALARVFLKDPGLVILDEASARLDPSTEMRMERAIDRLFAARTGVVIAHRLKTVQRADDILILENGRVVEYGPRRELAAQPASRFAALLRAGLEEALE